MRLKLSLETEPGSLLTVNYYYQLSSALYNLLRLGSPEFARYLHDTGYHMAGKTYKLFTFALRLQQATIAGGMLTLHTGKAQLFISTPLIDGFIKNIMAGSFTQQQITLTSGYRMVTFAITLAEVLPEPAFSGTMAFTLYSPLVLSTGGGLTAGGKLRQHFLRPEETDSINRVLTGNLANKAALLGYPAEPGAGVTLTWNAAYLASKGRITKKITIDEQSKNSVDVIGIQAPFSITGSPALIRAGYYCGFGEKNSMGFGFAETDQGKHFRNISSPRGGTE